MSLQQVGAGPLGSDDDTVRQVAAALLLVPATERRLPLPGVRDGRQRTNMHRGSEQHANTRLTAFLLLPDLLLLLIRHYLTLKAHSLAVTFGVPRSFLSLPGIKGPSPAS